MAAPSTVVIKVKHGDTLRRFSAQISDNDELILTMDGLRKKIISLFSFDPETELILTYVDEDNDLVTLGDDDDLRDVVKQELKPPLRINVKVRADKNGLHTSLNPSGPPHEPTNNGIPEILKTLPGPLYETLLKLSADLTSQASSSVRENIEKISADLAAKASLVLGDDSSSKEKGISKESEGLAKTKPAVKTNDTKPKRGPKPAHPSKAGPINPANSVDFPGTHYWYSPMVECPFSGLGTGTGSTSSSLPASEVKISRVGISHNDYSGNIFHRGICCDGCGVHPITGPRFKSKVRFDYDLCSICFEDMGNATDYIRMDRPAVYRRMSVKGLPEAAMGPPTFQQVHKSSKFKPVLPKLDSCFIKDVTIFDGTLMAPSTPFTKIWRMKHNGTASWPEKTKLVWIGGDKLSKELVVEIPPAGLMINEEFEVGVDFISPELPGRYISYWRIALPSGQQFGQRVWVLIQVDSSLADSPPPENVRNLNLNLPHVNINGPEIISVDDQPIVEDVSFGPTLPIKEDPVQKPNTEKKMKFPINDSVLVSEDGSSPTGFNPVQGQTPPASAPPVVGAEKIEDEKVEDKPPVKTVEEKLLKDLEDMGFKEVDLNKETLRKNGYNLLQAVDDLCGVAEWDPILEELQEMGFHDMETNKMLLKKNNGSIKRVVMDLIAGEKMQ